MDNETISLEDISKDETVSEICYGLRNLVVGDEEETRIADVSPSEFSVKRDYHQVMLLAEDGRYDQAYYVAIRSWSKDLKWPIEQAMDAWLAYGCTDNYDDDDNPTEVSWLFQPAVELYHKIMKEVPEPKLPYYDGSRFKLNDTITPDFMLSAGGIDLAIMLSDNDGEPEDIADALRQAADYVDLYRTNYEGFWKLHHDQLVDIDTGKSLATWKGVTTYE